MTERELFRETLFQIGNIVGGPTCAYSPDIEREELLARMQRIAAMVVEALKGG